MPLTCSHKSRACTHASTLPPLTPVQPLVAVPQLELALALVPELAPPRHPPSRSTSHTEHW